MRLLTEYFSWLRLQEHADSLRFLNIKDIQKNKSRNQSLLIHEENIEIDFSAQLITKETVKLLIHLANECNLVPSIEALTSGDKVNTSEAKPALHTALRARPCESLFINHCNIIDNIQLTLEKVKLISNQIRALKWLGFSGKPINNVVNIGMGGSDLGPRFCNQALSKFIPKHLNFYFISDVDPESFNQVVHNLNPETTLFIISSKSFTTQETLYNMQKAKEWIRTNQLDQHFIAITANIREAKHYGFKSILPLWDWVGGRFSLCSAISMITAIAIGFDQFSELLLGAYSMDEHFKNVPLEKNLPVLLGLFGIWNNNFLHINNLLMLIYSKKLEFFLPYLQQLEMESNGKSIDKQGNSVNYATCPIIWGGLGNQIQHSYFQLLCQGTHKITLDFLSIEQYKNELIYQMLESNSLVLTNGVDDIYSSFGFIPGNKPSNHIKLKDCSPFTLGQLVALYEHKVYTQGVIWNINSFDQPGVENAKRYQFNRAMA